MRCDQPGDRHRGLSGRFGANEPICVAGEIATEVFVLAGGDAAIVLGDGKRVATIDRGHIVGELGLFTDRKRTADVITLTECTILALDYVRFRRFLLAFPEATMAILGASIEQLAAGQRTDHGARPRVGG